MKKSPDTKPTDARSASLNAGAKINLKTPHNVALVHDWLTGMRGGERVLEILGGIYPQAPIYTLLCRKDAISQEIKRHQIHTSWLQHIPQIHKYYRYFLPLFPAAISSFRPPRADLVISTSHCVAKGIPLEPGTKHLCYCFTPMRYAWVFYEEYFGKNSIKKQVLDRVLASLRKWDYARNSNVTRFVAISEHVRQRIQKFYDRDADIVYPPVNTDYWHPGPGTPTGDFDLIVSALVPYKRVDLAIAAYNKLGTPLKIVGSGTEYERLRKEAQPNVKFLGWRPDAEIRELYRNCRCLVFPGEEDFGIVPVEAQACGRPVVAYGRGGALETVVAEKTGVFFNELTADSLAAAIQKCAEKIWDPLAIREHSEKFSTQNFINGITAAIERICG